MPYVAKSLINLGWVAHSRGEWKSAEAFVTDGLQLHREREDKSGIASALAMLGWMLGQRGEAGKAQSALEEALAIYRDLGNRNREAKLLTNLGNLGLIANGLQDQEAARAYFEQSLSLQRELGERLGIAITLVNLGALFCDQEDYAIARDCLVECLTLCQQLGAKRVAAYALEAFARLAKAQGREEASVHLWAAAHGLREAIACPLPPLDQEKVDRRVEILRTDLGEKAFTAAWNKGLAMTFEHAVSAALAFASHFH